MKPFCLLSQGGDLDMAEGASPLDLVVRILNNQLTSLLWIDEKVLRELKSRFNLLHDLLYHNMQT